MFIVIYRSQDYTRILGLYNSYYEALGNAFEFTENVVRNKDLVNNTVNINCDFKLYNVEPNGKEFRIERNKEISHIQIFEKNI